MLIRSLTSLLMYCLLATSVQAITLPDRKGPFSPDELDVGDFSPDPRMTKGIVASRDNRNPSAEGDTAPGDIDTALLGVRERGGLTFLFRPCSRQMRARLLTSTGKVVADIKEILEGPSGYVGEQVIPNLEAGVYIVQVVFTGQTPCRPDKPNRWVAEFSPGRLITDPSAFITTPMEPPSVSLIDPAPTETPAPDADLPKPAVAHPAPAPVSPAPAEATGTATSSLVKAPKQLAGGVIIGDFDQRAGPFTSDEQSVDDFTHDFATTKGIVQQRPSGVVIVSGGAPPGDVDVALFGLGEDGNVAVTLRPCSASARLKVFDIEGKLLAETGEVGYGYYGLYAKKEIAGLKKGAYALVVEFPDGSLCDDGRNGWTVDVAGHVVDPQPFVGPFEDKPDYSVREDLNVDDLIGDLERIVGGG